MPGSRTGRSRHPSHQHTLRCPPHAGLLWAGVGMSSRETAPRSPRGPQAVTRVGGPAAVSRAKRSFVLCVPTPGVHFGRRPRVEPSLKEGRAGCPAHSTETHSGSPVEPSTFEGFPAARAPRSSAPVITRPVPVPLVSILCETPGFYGVVSAECAVSGQFLQAVSSIPHLACSYAGAMNLVGPGEKGPFSVWAAVALEAACFRFHSHSLQDCPDVCPKPSLMAEIRGSSQPSPIWLTLKFKRLWAKNGGICPRMHVSCVTSQTPFPEDNVCRVLGCPVPVITQCQLPASAALWAQSTQRLEVTVRVASEWGPSSRYLHMWAGTRKCLLPDNERGV